jgi:ABC-type hemin transport system substrate-binding protein
MLLLAAILLLAGCERRPPLRGPETGPRIAVLSPALSEMLVAMGLEGQIVGRAGFDLVLEPSIPVVGDQREIDYEALLSTRPTHILLQWGRRPLPDRLVRLATEREWVVKNIEILTLEEIKAAAEDLAALFRPELSGQMSRQLDEAWRREEGLAAAGRILLLHSVKPAGAMGPGSFHYQLLERIGGQPAIREGRPNMVLDAEDVLRLAPDGIIVFAPRERGSPTVERSEDELREMLGRIGRLDIPALRQGHIAVIDHPLGLLPGVCMGEVAEEVRQVLRDWGE